MQVHVKLYSRFREHLPREARGEAVLELPEGATVGQLIDHLAIAQRIRLIVVNDEPENDLGRVLQSDDRVRIFPVVVGG
jgi:molybdopterin converting factor small subunit